MKNILFFQSNMQDDLKIFYLKQRFLFILRLSYLKLSHTKIILIENLFYLPISMLNIEAPPCKFQRNL